MSYNQHQLYEWHRKCEQIIQKYNVENLRRQKIVITATVGAVIAWATENLKKKRRYKKKRTWITEFFEQRRRYGFYYTALPILKLEDLRFRNYFRMSTIQFEELLELVAPKITRQYAIREPIEAGQRLSICLRYLASGDSMTSMSYQYLVSLTAVSKIISETCQALWEILSPLVLVQCNESAWKAISHDFNEKWHFPHCIRAIDGKHVIIQSPEKSGSAYFNYKKTHSIVLLAMCDANYLFTYVDIGAFGRQSDGGIFKQSEMGQRFAQGKMNVPAADEIYEGSTTYPYVIVGDEAFPLTSYLMRPYPGRGELTTEKKIYNYRLSRARRVIENAFGILAAQWRFYRKSTIAKVDTTEKMVKATIVLHNWLRKQDLSRRETFITPEMVDREGNDGSIIPGTWRNIVASNNSAFQDIAATSTHTHTRVAADIRNKFTEYFYEEGAVPWQFSRIYQ
ncbi:putative nuclease HARBI1 [Temnothorax nylanderi]|uniref:putative nuclease HARBI1 n=1 Tax=Temnothorax nylanderi TaxID=102681 RepID=UPI003A8496C9